MNDTLPEVFHPHTIKRTYDYSPSNSSFHQIAFQIFNEALKGHESANL